jgi:sigma-B regulation protein RsbU (phosphoserine phosphatase)
MDENLAILLAEDSEIQSVILKRLLEDIGYRVDAVSDGLAAADMMGRKSFSFLITDLMMPSMSGIELIRAVRAMNLPGYVFTILMTSKGSRGDFIEGMEAGADDFLTKPVDADLLRVRLRAGERILRLERGLAERNRVLETALGEVKKLSGLLPICANCKKIRDDQGYWHQVENYIKERSDADFTHALCPSCMTELYPEIRHMMEGAGRGTERKTEKNR